ncbi:Peptidase A1 [Macleaya cordata]|uniref:Peptidase A1 n=1 Tax=Macleaya cordata TaxID=56857 RepID=A0A200Q1E9_MACCD|nr:Peptidase A1 [Macleaya cordata]
MHDDQTIVSENQPWIISMESPHASDTSDTSSLKIVHRQQPCSKPHQLNEHQETTKSPDQTLDQFLLQDQIRVNYIQSILSKNKNNNSVELERKKDSKASIPANSGLPLGIGNYFVTVGFGTPKRDLSVIFDTGSDFTWIQCKPCVGFCHEQEEPIFDPIQSKTYSNITCNTTECAQLRSATSISPGCNSSTCIYGIQYGDQSYSVGYFGSEKLTLTPKDVFPKFLFGCGQKNRGLFGRTAGLVGLGRDRLSLISQTAKKYGKIFSYCLPATLNSTGYLKFGNEKRDMKSKSSIKFTPLLTDSRGPSFYFLDLISISVGGTKLSIQPSVFASSGTIIDSGTVISRLPSSAYSVLRSNFRNSMSQYPLTQPTRLLDTCYNLSSYDAVSVPKIALYFRGGAKLDVTFSGILLGRPEQICLAFAGNQDDKDVAIIGNRQQQTFKVLYNVARNKLGFIPGGCS